MTHGSVVRLTTPHERLPRGAAGRIKGFYRRPDATELVVSFGGQVELLREADVEELSRAGAGLDTLPPAA